MGIILSFTFSLVLLVVLWSLNVKALDSTLIMVLIMSIASAVHLLKQHLPGAQHTED